MIDDNANRRLLTAMAIIAVVTLVSVSVLLRELYYGAYPHLRPQAPVSAGTVETCDHDCALRRVRFITDGEYRASGFFASVIVIWRPLSPEGTADA